MNVLRVRREMLHQIKLVMDDLENKIKSNEDVAAGESYKNERERLQKLHDEIRYFICEY